MMVVWMRVVAVKIRGSGRFESCLGVDRHVQKYVYWGM